MTVTREAICTEALTWLGTPWRHRACMRGVGVDCVRLAEGVCKALGLLDSAYEPSMYSPEWNLHRNEELLQEALQAQGCIIIPPMTRLPGDLVCFQFGRVVSHTGFVLPDDRVIHAAQDYGRVVVHGLRGEWLTRLRTCYRLPGIEGAV